MTIISATEAKNFYSLLHREQDLQTLDRMIRDAARKGETSIRVPHIMCILSGHSVKFKIPALEEEFRKAGYGVTTKTIDHNDCRNVLAIEISWDRPQS